jgi:hypothetical protein
MVMAKPIKATGNMPLYTVLVRKLTANKAIPEDAAMTALRF